MDEQLKAIKGLSEKTRIRILALLHKASEICVSDLVESLQESQCKVSRHLKVLQEAGLVEGSKKGRWTYYQLNQKHSYFVKMLLNAVNYIPSDLIKDDLMRLQKKLPGYVDFQSSGNDSKNTQS